MAHTPLTTIHIDRIRDLKERTADLRKYGKQVMIMLDAEFSSPDAQGLGVTLVLAQDGLSAQIASPFGSARAIFSVYLGSTGLYGRYAFQRRDADQHDRESWSEVFYLDISTELMITSEYVSENSPRFNAIRAYRDQYFELALAITAALGRNPADSAV
ncbi:hypothetical protein AB9V60_13450 [Pseudomonas syringae pv. atrofaciens]|uniref:hypothetical protein n=1 Tax=Pseudomonas syringae TaxID=317 RepID=UPI00351EE88D